MFYLKGKAEKERWIEEQMPALNFWAAAAASLTWSQHNHPIHQLPDTWLSPRGENVSILQSYELIKGRVHVLLTLGSLVQQ